ncbi:unnamed protein product [Effrenium voratum]|nr:unnamed protein product [Effrenium voratum]
MAAKPVESPTVFESPTVAPTSPTYTPTEVVSEFDGDEGLDEGYEGLPALSEADHLSSLRQDPYMLKEMQALGVMEKEVVDVQAIDEDLWRMYIDRVVSRAEECFLAAVKHFFWASGYCLLSELFGLNVCAIGGFDVSNDEFSESSSSEYEWVVCEEPSPKQVAEPEESYEWVVCEEPLLKQVAEPELYEWVACEEPSPKRVAEPEPKRRRI